MKLLSFVITFLVSSLSFARPDFSAFRDPGKSYLYYTDKLESRFPTRQGLDASAYGAARYFENDIPQRTTNWSSLSDLNDRFKLLRDSRFIISTNNPKFPRRISWLYPHDGCWVRAAVAGSFFKDRAIAPPGKVFAFGNLKVKTKNARAGAVYWWFHVASIVEINLQKYVLDPSIEAKSPLPLKEWLSRMGEPSKIRVAICSPATFSTDSSCNSTYWYSGMSDQKYYLNYEWSNLRSLGRDPVKELGDGPPWITKKWDIL